MIHYTCDRCRKAIDSETELRYEVSIVTQVVLDGPESTGDDDERDNLNDVDELLQRIDDEECEELCQDLYQSRRYDLCATCYQQYKQDPLGAEPLLQVGFSEN